MIMNRHLNLPKTPEEGKKQIKQRLYDMSEKIPVTGSLSHIKRHNAVSFDMHYQLEMGIVLGGMTRKYWGEYHRDLTKGDLWLCGIWEPHGNYIKRPYYRSVSLRILPEFITSLKTPEAPWMNWLLPFAIPASERPRVQDSDRSWFVHKGQETSYWLTSQKQSRLLWLRILVMQILVKYSELITDRMRQMSKTSISRFGKINPAIQLVLERSDFIHLNEAATVCGMSPSVFSRTFRTAMDISFANYALKYRVKKALDMICTNGDLIKTAIYDWGFTDHSHFTKCFKKFYNMKLKDYLNLNSSDVIT